MLIVMLISSIYATEMKKVLFYTTDSNINNFKSLKISFDRYLQQFGLYEFQPFSDKSTFERYLTSDNLIVILSSWHYQQISKTYNLQAKLVGKKQNSITNRIILVGQKNMPLKGVVTSAYDKEYARKTLDKLADNADLRVLVVPKEIDALMSVGFGMSNFALVSQDSLTLLKEINPMLADNLTIYKKSDPVYRMLLAYSGAENKKLIELFLNMGKDKESKDILNMIGIDGMQELTPVDLRRLGGVK